MKFLFAILLAAVTFSCTKYEVNEVPNNTPPVDQTLTIERQTNYINRLYITLLGFKPDTATLKVAMAQLAVNPNSISLRESLVASIIAHQNYPHKLWEDVRGDLLDGVDTNTIRLEYNQAAANFAITTGWQKQYWLDQMLRLQPLFTIPQEIAAGQITLNDVHRRAVNNSIYDEINMGTENFVVSIFQNFFFRYPTAAELAQGKSMVDGNQGIIFLTAGSTKADFLAIVFSSPSYYEGQISYLYQKYLYRVPSSEELSTGTVAYLKHNDYQLLQTEILASNEFVFN